MTTSRMQLNTNGLMSMNILKTQLKIHLSIALTTIHYESICIVRHLVLVTVLTQPLLMSALDSYQLTVLQYLRPLYI
jgi:hypothetical protein